MKEFFKVADDLYKIGLTYTGKKREFYFRSAVSRAYYGVLWFIRNYYSLRGTDLHGMARAVLAKNNIDLKNMLEMLGKVRNYADYYEKIPIDFDAKSVKFYIELAKSIVLRLKK
ncbi:hypothetical protein [Hydrogenivirga sp. 128-5-R1-1]|uniref:hypothetical protein n=1 Tax=Hydrogenivirga sp. 128-5-R1-1 TaxID=392423 RepID=UPI00015F2BB8|nr:hypothetical protein [Hydrogenivirga sp. 128-5-R1-1]EDP73524.1 hypothetical protein HG1285_09471 [Hydrogenivirga sp. 128-5-R1-1]